MPKSTKIRTPEQQERRLASKLLPAVQAGRGGFTMVDVSNHSDGDQRHMMRSNERKTLRRTPKLMVLRRAMLIDDAELKVCQWYADQHALGYDTIGITANYDGQVGSGGTSCHAARYRAQDEARSSYTFARAGISPMLIHLFERVVLHGRPIGKLKLSFKRAVTQLCDRVGTIEAAE